MRPRPRKAENRCAEEVTKAIREYGIDFTFVRIPVLGREGPDMTYPNPLNLVVDVKTQFQVPRKLFHPFYEDAPMYRTYRYAITQVKNLPALWTNQGPMLIWNSLIVEKWLEHISIWADERLAIPCLILHRPDMDYQNSAVIIWLEDRESLRTNAQTAKLLSLPGAYRRGNDEIGGYYE